MPFRARIRDVDLSLLRPKPRPALQYDPFLAPWNPPQHETWHDEYRVFANPAAGAGLAAQVVSGLYWEQLLIVRVRFVASAAVANRVIILNGGQAVDTSNFLFEVQTPTNITASQTIRTTFMRGVAPSGGVLGNTQHVAIPEWIMAPGNYWGIGVNAIDVGDQLSQLSALVRCWPNRPNRLSRQHPR